MVNLKQLEKQLDTALSKETNKTLTEWMLKQRVNEAIKEPFKLRNNDNSSERYK